MEDKQMTKVTADNFVSKLRCGGSDFAPVTYAFLDYTKPIEQIKTRECTNQAQIDKIAEDSKIVSIAEEQTQFRGLVYHVTYSNTYPTREEMSAKEAYDKAKSNLKALKKAYLAWNY